MKRGFASVIPERWCNHPELFPAAWEQKRPKPALMVGSCEYNMGCPVCGYGWGCAPDPCDERRRDLVNS